MEHVCNQKYSLCNETPVDCCFEQRTFAQGTIVHNDDLGLNYLIYCQSECTGTALSDVTLFVHKFNNTVCKAENCMLSYLYKHRHYDSKIYCFKLTAQNSLQGLMSSVESYITDETHDNDLWKLKHKELIWVFTRYYSVEELRSFFPPMGKCHSKVWC